MLISTTNFTQWFLTWVILWLHRPYSNSYSWSSHSVWPLVIILTTAHLGYLLGSSLFSLGFSCLISYVSACILCAISRLASNDLPGQNQTRFGNPFQYKFPDNPIAWSTNLLTHCGWGGVGRVRHGDSQLDLKLKFKHVLRYLMDFF